MNILAQMPSLQAQRRASQPERRTTGAMANTAAGTQIGRVGGGAAALAISEKAAAALGFYEGTDHGYLDGANMMQTARSVLSSAHDTLGRMRGLAAHASSDIYTGDQRAAMQQEYGALMGELNDISSQARLSQKKLFAGAVAGSDVSFVPAGFAPPENAGVSGAMALPIDEMVSGALRISDTKLSSQREASDALDRLGGAMDTVARRHSMLGASQGWLEGRAARQATGAENLLAARSKSANTNISMQMIKTMSDRFRDKASNHVLRARQEGGALRTPG